jgi:hypothetical protein
VSGPHGLPLPAGERVGERASLAALSLLCLAACAPTSLAPSIIRYEPLDPNEPEHRLGLRTGPRLSSSLARLEAGTLDRDVGTVAPPEVGLALEYQRTQPFTSGLAVHLGVQAEIFYALPLPGLGVMAGLSWRKQLGSASIAPAIAVRGATDFGIATVTVPGSFIGGDVGVSISAAESDTARIGVTPFFSVWQSLRGSMATVLFTGAMVFARFRMVELLAGFGRMYTGGAAWNVPLFGVRLGGN